jgi:hypothetical protein
MEFRHFWVKAYGDLDAAQVWELVKKQSAMISTTAYR